MNFQVMGSIFYAVDFSLDVCADNEQAARECAERQVRCEAMQHRVTAALCEVCVDSVIANDDDDAPEAA